MNTITVKTRVGTLLTRHKFQNAYLADRGAFIVIVQEQMDCGLRENWFQKGTVTQIVLTDTDGRGQ